MLYVHIVLSQACLLVIILFVGTWNAGLPPVRCTPPPVRAIGGPAGAHTEEMYNAWLNSQHIPHKHVMQTFTKTSTTWPQNVTYKPKDIRFQKIMSTIQLGVSLLALCMCSDGGRVNKEWKTL